jgi:hypothetical protein
VRSSHVASFIVNANHSGSEAAFCTSFRRWITLFAWTKSRILA